MASRRRGRGEGSLFQQKDGRWVAQISLGWSAGKRRFKRYYGSTRQEASEKLAGGLAELRRTGTLATDERATVESYLQDWIKTVAVRPKTLRSYEQIVRLHLIPSLGALRLARLQPSHVRHMLSAKEGSGLSARTVTYVRDVLRIALNQAVSDGLVPRNVASLVRRPRGLRPSIKVLTPDEARAFLAANAGRRLHPAALVGLSVGLRLGEVLGLQWSDIDLESGRVSISKALQTNGKERTLVPTKSRESKRTVQLPRVTIEALKEHRRRQLESRLLAGPKWHGGDFVFTTRLGRPLDGTNVTRDLKRLLARTWVGGEPDCNHVLDDGTLLCKKCGSTRLPAVSFHSLRHSCASFLLAQNVPVRDVSEVLGHSDVRLTLQTYAHVFEAGRDRAASLMDRVLAKTVG